MFDILGSRKKPPNGMKVKDRICEDCADSKYDGLDFAFSSSLLPIDDTIRYIINYEVDYSKLVTAIDEIIKELEWEISDGNISNGYVTVFAGPELVPFCSIRLDLKKQTNSIMLDMEFATNQKPEKRCSSEYFNIFLTLLNQKLGYDS